MPSKAFFVFKKCNSSTHRKDAEGAKKKLKKIN